MTDRVFIAGYGVMGQRYLQKLRRYQDQWGIEPVGVADPRLAANVSDGVPLFPQLSDGLHITKPDIVINATSSASHLDVFYDISQCPTVKAVLTEKPLVEFGHEEEAAHDLLAGKFVSMNQVTNFGRNVDFLKGWMEDNSDSLTLIGVDSAWGKNRRKDDRPTPGIASDMVHPAGLMQAIFGMDAWPILHGNGFYGTLSTDRARNRVDCVYAYHLGCITPKGPARFDASYAWQDKTRRLTAFFNDAADGDYKIAELSFDEDMGEKRQADFFRLYSFDGRGIDRLREETVIHSDKLSQFLSKSFNAYQDAILPEKAGLVGLRAEKSIGGFYAPLVPASIDVPGIASLLIQRIAPDRTPPSSHFPAIAHCPVHLLRARIGTLRDMTIQTPPCFAAG